jgi:protein ImuB
LALPCRIACVRIGRFAIGALRSAPTGDPSASRGSNTATDAEGGGAAVAVADIGGKPRVAATSREAERHGIAAGMALAEAKALAADLLVLPWDEERIARAALEVATALLAASPRVSWEGMSLPTAVSARLHTLGIWWVDAAGLGSEAKLADRLLIIASSLGFGSARTGVASSAIAAYAATFGGTGARRRGGAAVRPRIVPPGDDAAYLAPFPVALLDLDDDLAEILRGLGLTTLGQLAALEADEVDARFGPEGLAAHRRARGVDTRGPSTPRDDALPAVEVDLGGSVATAEPLLFVLRGALATLGEALRAKGLAARELTIALRLDDGSTAERAVRPARATSHADALFDHCRTALETWQLPEPATGLVLRAAITVPAAGEQGDLLALRWADPAALTAAFDRIRGSEGSDAVAIPEARDAHLPEDGGAWASAETQRHGGTEAQRHRAWGPRLSVPLCARASVPTAALRLLGAPVPVHVRLGREGLAAFRHADCWHDVTGWSGPERLAPRWWLGVGAVRDYYATRTADGALWLLYRATGGQWFLEGWWD